MRAPAGFTLSELLIALTVLGVIATFTIPKVLQSQQNEKNIAISKEAAAMISGAFEGYRQQNGLAAGTSAFVLTPYMNYVKLDTSGEWLDQTPDSGLPMQACNNGMCLHLHNGAILFLHSNTFASTASTSMIDFIVDPDATFDGNQQSLRLFLYTTGRITTPDGLLPNSCTSLPWCFATPNPADQPAWFSWN